MESKGQSSPSDADLANMLQLLLQLKASDPNQYQETLKSLGLEGLAESLEKQFPNEELNSQNTKESPLNTVSQLTNAINKLRNEETKTSLDNLKVGQDQVKGMHITPTPGFSYKTLTMSDQAKVFINITQHEAIGEPKMAKKLDAEGNEVEGLNVPMSVGTGRADVDKKGVSCTVYDIVVHPTVLTDCKEDDTGKYREFICQLGIQSIEQKYNLQLDKRYKIPKLAYMGKEVPSQYIKDRKSMPTIQEVNSSSASSSAKKAKSSLKTAIQPVPVPEQDLDLVAYWCSLNVAEKKTDSENMQDLLNYCSTSPDSFTTDEKVLKQKLSGSLLDYIEPIQAYPDGTTALLLVAEIQAYELLPRDTEISISPYKISMKLPQYRKYIGYFSACIQPTHSFFKISSIQGFVSKKRVEVILPLDLLPWDSQPDAGSKPWLLTQALSYDDQSTGDGHSNNAPNPYGSTNHVKASDSTARAGDEARNSYPEDKFHINLPDNVDHYTGVKYDNSQAGENLDDIELPEDRFHKKDATSNYIISQREEAKRQKWEKHEKEKAERQNDPNIEYVEMEDFRPGGKYGPRTSSEVVKSLEEEKLGSEELRKASQVLAQSAGELKKTNVLSSALWTELLD